MTSPKILIRAAREPDVPLVLEFIRKLAVYERLAHQVEATEAVLRDSLFGNVSRAEVLLAFEGETPAGFALFFHNFSTFVGRAGLYLEDIYVNEEFRGRGIGTALFRRLAQIAVERDCGRFEWAVLDWNSSAIRFYEGIGAKALSDWRLFRLTGEPLGRLAALSDGEGSR
jgi:GNAT superfamily N-acetyltransferase